MIPPPIFSQMNFIYNEWLEENWVQLIDTIIDKAHQKFSKLNWIIENQSLHNVTLDVWKEMYIKFWAIVDTCDEISDDTGIEFDDSYILEKVSQILEWYEVKILKILEKEIWTVEK